MFLQKYTKIYPFHKGLEYTSYNDILVIGIHELLMNILSCNVFVKDDTNTVILTYKNKLVFPPNVSEAIKNFQEK